MTTYDLWPHLIVTRHAVKYQGVCRKKFKTQGVQVESNLRCCLNTAIMRSCSAVDIMLAFQVQFFASHNFCFTNLLNIIPIYILDHDQNQWTELKPHCWLSTPRSTNCWEIGPFFSHKWNEVDREAVQLREQGKVVYRSRISSLQAAADSRCGSLLQLDDVHVQCWR